MRDGDWKVLADAKQTKFELYNLRQDIGEKQDLAAQEPERLKTMAARLKQIHAQVQAEGPRWPAAKKPAKGERD
jgi:arylsulfatase A-like enzyme